MNESEFPADSGGKRCTRQRCFHLHRSNRGQLQELEKRLKNKEKLVSELKKHVVQELSMLQREEAMIEEHLKKASTGSSSK